MSRETPDVDTALPIATVTRKETPCAVHDARGDGRSARSRVHAAMPFCGAIDRTEFERGVGSLINRLNDELVKDDKMISLVKAIALFGKSTGANWVMRAHVAAHMVRGIIYIIRYAILMFCVPNAHCVTIHGILPSLSSYVFKSGRVAHIHRFGKY